MMDCNTSTQKILRGTSANKMALNIFLGWSDCFLVSWLFVADMQATTLFGNRRARHKNLTIFGMVLKIIQQTDRIR